MSTGRALNLFLDLIKDHFRISNRDKSIDDELIAAYNLLHTKYEKTFCLSDDLQESIDDGTLKNFKKEYDDNGYTVTLTVEK